MGYSGRLVALITLGDQHTNVVADHFLTGAALERHVSTLFESAGALSSTMRTSFGGAPRQTALFPVVLAFAFLLAVSCSQVARWTARIGSTPSVPISPSLVSSCS